MATHIHEEMVFHSAVITQREWSVENNNFDQAPAVISTTAVSPGRRCEARMDYRRMCSYEVVEAIEERPVVIGQREAFAVNRSTEVMLLLIALVPHADQLIEVHTSCFGWGRTVNIFEVRWTRPVEAESLGNLYLIGCRRILGPCHYLSF